MQPKKKVNRRGKYIGFRVDMETFELLESIRGVMPRGQYVRNCLLIVAGRMRSADAFSANEIRAAIGRLFAILGRANISEVGRLSGLLADQQAVTTPEVECAIQKGADDLHELVALLRQIAAMCERR